MALEQTEQADHPAEEAQKVGGQMETRQISEHSISEMLVYQPGIRHLSYDWLFYLFLETHVSQVLASPEICVVKHDQPLKENSEAFILKATSLSWGYNSTMYYFMCVVPGSAKNWLNFCLRFFFTTFRFFKYSLTYSFTVQVQTIQFLA